MKLAASGVKNMNNINLSLHSYGVKDFTRDDCEHCGLCYERTAEFFNGKQITRKIQCDDCVEAERTIERIHNVMTRSTAKLNALDPVKEADEVSAFQALIQKQKAKLKIVLDAIRRTTREKTNKELASANETRLPYKE